MAALVWADMEKTTVWECAPTVISNETDIVRQWWPEELVTH